jgi:hypothetical protein
VILGEIDTLNGYDGLVAIFRARCDALGITGETVDHVGGLASGHTTKLLTAGHMKKFGPVSLNAILGVLALKLTVSVDEEQLARIAPRLVPATYRRWSAGKAVPAKRRRPKTSYPFGKNPALARLMRLRQILTTSPRQRRRAARHAAQVRWSRVDAGDHG